MIGTLYFLFANREYSFLHYHNRRILASGTQVFENGKKEILTENFGKDLPASCPEVRFISAYNHFSMLPEGYEEHDLALKIIGANAELDPDGEEAMLSINKKHRCQFYFSIPTSLYKDIKTRYPHARFNFSGEQFLQKINPGKTLEAHIHFYENQFEFYIFNQRKILLYNNLHSQEEVDFLYFVLFSLQKLQQDFSSCKFYLYGAVQEHETFISELKKLVSKISIEENPARGKGFIF